LAVSLNQVSFSYPGSLQKAVLDIPSWTVSDGEKVFVHGPSGCGKSTLLNLLSGMNAATEGEVAVLGQRLDEMSQRKRNRFRANHVGYVFQQFNLIPYLNAIENVELATHFCDGTKTAKKADIEGLLSTLNIASDRWYKKTSELSIGQQQRIAIARALINKPELLIADEPTSSLDEANRDNFMQMLMSLVDANGITLIFVSHDMSMSKYFERVDALAAINQANTDQVRTDQASIPIAREC